MVAPGFPHDITQRGCSYPPLVLRLDNNSALRYHKLMIKGFCCKETEKIFQRHYSKKLSPIHPGEILLEEFLKPLGISQYKLAKDIHVPARRINEIVHGKRSITANTALRLSRYFKLSERFWLNLQARYDLEVEKDKLSGQIEAEVKVFEIQNA